MEKRYFFEAYAVGFSSQIRRPFRHLIHVQASSVVPSSGGFDRSRAREFCFEGLVRFDSAETVVTGSATADGNTFDTLSSATIENLNILGQVTADRVVAHMTSQYVRGTGYPKIIALGSRFEGLRIAGQPVDLDLSRSEHCRAPDDEYEGRRPEPLELTSLVTELPDLCGVSKSGNQYTIPHFGTISIADYLKTPYTRTLTMLRLELGSPFENSSVVCEIGGGGIPYPPDNSGS
ncbi:MAG: hypothetical protein M3Z23_00900 [Acidobacteriota bacterium]|nr:hypothetical protein [Acidobacteriota bacterium]